MAGILLMTPLLALESLFGLFDTMRGPEFLGVYIVIFIVLRSLVAWLRSSGVFEVMSPVVCCCVFEGIGLLRYMEGSARGMHNWEFMFILMFFGGITFFIRFDNLGNGSGSGSCSGSSCGGGGCGGGGCGGGGCGGCGGG